MSTRALLQHLPEVLRDLSAGSQPGALQHPYLESGCLCCTDGTLSLAAPARAFRSSLLARFRPRPIGVPSVLDELARWEGDGMRHALPGLDGDDLRPGSVVVVGATPVLLHRIGYLLGHGVRVVSTGRTPAHGLAFEAGEVVQGLLMPAPAGRKRNPWDGA